MPQLVADETPQVQGIRLFGEDLHAGRSDHRQLLDAVNDRHRCVYDTLADEYNKKSVAHTTTTEGRVNHVAEHVEPGSEILDVGCGVGLALLMLSKHEKDFNATGVDVSPKMVELAVQRSPRTPVFTGDFLTVDFNTTYDAIWEQALLHLFPRVVEDYIFERFRMLLKPRGILSLSTTVAEVSREGWEAKVDYGTAPARFRRSITEAELRTSLVTYGFELRGRWITTDPFGKNWLTVIGKKL